MFSLGGGGSRGHADSLPTTIGGTGGGSQRRGFQGMMEKLFRGRGNYPDGSARSIRTTVPVVQTWNRSSVAFKRAIMIVGICIMMMLLGWRRLRYYNGSFHLNCHATECTLTLVPVGWGKRVSSSFPRTQLIKTLAVRTTQEGEHVSDNPNLNDDIRTVADRKKKNSKNKKSGSYKGPDEEGYFISYAIILRQHKDGSNRALLDDDDDDTVLSPEFQKQKDEMLAAAKKNQEILNTSILSQYGVPVEENNSQKRGQSTDYRITARLFGIQSSKRRVRTMTQRIESYIKHRRQKLIVKENSPPSWVGILLLVLGLVGFLLALLFAFFEEDEDAYERSAAARRKKAGGAAGPGARRHMNGTSHSTAGGGGIRRPTSSSSSSKKGGTTTPVSSQTMYSNTTPARRQAGNESFLLSPAGAAAAPSVPNYDPLATSSGHSSSTLTSRTAATTRRRN